MRRLAFLMVAALALARCAAPSQDIATARPVMVQPPPTLEVAVLLHDGIDDDARAAFAAAGRAIDSGDLPGALTSLLDAQAADPYAPQILFNLGYVSARLPGHELRAIAWLKAYLMLAPTASNAPQVLQTVRLLQQRFEQRHRDLIARGEALTRLYDANIDEMAQTGAEPEWVTAAAGFTSIGFDFLAVARLALDDVNGALRDSALARDALVRRSQIVSKRPITPSDWEMYEPVPGDLPRHLQTSRDEIRAVDEAPPAERLKTLLSVARHGAVISEDDKKDELDLPDYLLAQHRQLAAKQAYFFIVIDPAIYESDIMRAYRSVR